MSLNTSKLHTSVGRAIKPLNIAGASARMHSRDYIEIINVIYKDNPNGNCCSKTHKLPKVDDKPILRKRWHVRKYDEGENEICPSSAGRVDGERRLGTGYIRQGSGLVRGSTANSAYRRKVLDVNDQDYINPPQGVNRYNTNGTHLEQSEQSSSDQDYINPDTDSGIASYSSFNKSIQSHKPSPKLQTRFKQRNNRMDLAPSTELLENYQPTPPPSAKSKQQSWNRRQKYQPQSIINTSERNQPTNMNQQRQNNQENFERSERDYTKPKSSNQRDRYSNPRYTNTEADSDKLSESGDSISNLPKSLSKTELLCSCREGIIYVKKTHEWQNLLNEYRNEILKLRECLKDRPRSSRGKFKHKKMPVRHDSINDLMQEHRSNANYLLRLRMEERMRHERRLFEKLSRKTNKININTNTSYIISARGNCTTSPSRSSDKDCTTTSSSNTDRVRNNSTTTEASSTPSPASSPSEEEWKERGLSDNNNNNNNKKSSYQHHHQAVYAYKNIHPQKKKPSQIPQAKSKYVSNVRVGFQTHYMRNLSQPVQNDCEDNIYGNQGVLYERGDGQRVVSYGSGVGRKQQKVVVRKRVIRAN